ncbi:MAG: ATP-binding cassette domain-containing protein, partial [Pseudohongiellaceae bacterium]
MPQMPAMIAYGTAFTVGWLLHRQAHLLTEWKKRWQLNLAVAVALTAVCLQLVGLAPVIEPYFGAAVPVWHKPVYTAAYTMAIWFWTFGLIGAALRFFSKASDLQRYLADSSYWLYLAHLPVVFLLQVLLMNVNLHWSLKFPLILLVTMTVLLLSYHYMVRSTFIGKALNGRKFPRRRAGMAMPAMPDPAPTTTPPNGGGKKPVAALQNVTHRYGSTTALNAVSLTVEPGELLAVLGPNGAGKSTAISLWLGMLEPDEGNVELMGKSPLEVENRLEIGVMMQEVSLAPELRAREQIELTASYYPNPLAVNEVISLTQIKALANKRYSTMSTGQKRQVQFATAICGRPKLLFLDEPTVGLDIKSREMMWQTIRRLLGQGCSIVLTTHYLEEAEALADRVAVLAKGQLIALGSVDEVRSIVTRRQIKCNSSIEVDQIKQWSGVISATREENVIRISATEAETVVRRLLDTDQQLSNLEIKVASLADAFTSLTEEAA